MIQYKDGAAFRRALEERLRSRNQKTGIPLARLRKMVVFDRYLARLIQTESNQWVIKGGYAIQLRLIDRARTTKDIDLLALGDSPEALNLLRRAGKCDLGDWFSFEVEQGEDQFQEPLGGARYHIRSLLDGRIFEEFHIDVGIGDPVIDPVDHLEGPSLLEFANIRPAIAPCYPVTQQIAEKVHAYTRPHLSGESSRVKDFVDILLLAELGAIEAKRLLFAIQATFQARKTHPLPDEMPDPPHDWAKSYQKMAAEVSLNYPTLSQATSAFKNFLDPLFGRDLPQKWDPKAWSWR